MWYVMQVLTRQEREIRDLCREKIMLPGEDVFLMQGERMFKTENGWETRKYVLFPGYVFVETGDIAGFQKRLGQIHAMRKLLKVGDEIVPIEPEEERFLQDLGGAEHVVRYSEGYREGDRLVITEGAMKGREGMIKKIDRHHRSAIIEVMLLGQPVEVRLGLGIVESKRPSVRSV